MRRTSEPEPKPSVVETVSSSPSHDLVKAAAPVVAEEKKLGRQKKEKDAPKGTLCLGHETVLTLLIGPMASYVMFSNEMRPLVSGWISSMHNRRFIVVCSAS